MTIFNYYPTSVDTERNIISFLPHEDQVTVSGVNTKAYKILSNNGYFYNLFLMKYCSFETGEKCLEKHLEILHNRHPSNCWKVACCFFQASRMNFSQAFFNEEIPHLEMEISRCESRIKEICGNSYEDPSSRIHKAWVAYQDQKGICNLLMKQAEGLESLYIQIVIDTGRADEWEALYQKMEALKISDEEKLPFMKKFDERMVSYFCLATDCNTARKESDILANQYHDLENERVQNVNSIERIRFRLNVIKNSDFSYFPSLKIPLLLNPLEKHLANQLAAIPQATGKELYQTFKAWNNLEFRGNILNALEYQKEKNPAMVNGLQPCQENLFLDAIEEYASVPIERLQDNFNHFRNKICGFFTNLPKEFVTQKLLEAIETKHGVRLNPNQN